jgi:hypothetical protein
MTPTRIIAPITFAADSLAAAAVAAGLAASLDAELLLAGIAPLDVPDDDGTGDRDPLGRRADEQPLLDRLIGERLEQFVGALARGVRARTLLTWGPAGAAVGAAPPEHPAAHGVVPLPRAGQLAHLLHDRAERFVLRHSRIPVLVVPTDAPDGTRTS